jgi:membrane-associated phospholipid phosphatase
MNNHRKRILFYVLGSIVTGFILLTLIVLHFKVSVVDLEFSEELQEHQYPVLDLGMKLISWFGYMPYSLFMVLISALAFYLMKYKKEGLFILLTLCSGLVTAVMKLCINRPRPTQDLVRIVEKAGRQSFPSGHVLFYVVFFGFLILLMYHLKTLSRSLRITVSATSFFLIFTIPLSRVYLGAHWFTDVLGGFLLGMVSLLILSFFYLRNPDATG